MAQQEEHIVKLNQELKQRVKTSGYTNPCTCAANIPTCLPWKEPKVRSSWVPSDEPLHAPMGYALLPSDKKTGATKALFRNDHIVIGAWPHAAPCPGPEECRSTNLVIRDHLKEPWSNPMVEHSPIAPVAQQLQGADIWGLALTET